MRIYVVKTAHETRIVRAKSREQAARHVVFPGLKVYCPSVNEMVELMQQGLDVEDYKDPAQQELPLGKDDD